jgi:IS4 transposase
MEHYGTELTAPNKVNRRTPTQDGRPLRRYRKRWKIERLFARLFNFRHNYPLEVFMRWLVESGISNDISPLY